MSRKKIVIELTEYEAKVLRAVLSRVRVHGLIPSATHAQNMAQDRIYRQVWAHVGNDSP